jgi:hypothetical protein
MKKIYVTKDIGFKHVGCRLAEIFTVIQTARDVMSVYRYPTIMVDKETKLCLKEIKGLRAKTS